MATILVVDDDSGIRALIQSILNSAGHDVLEAENGLDGWLRLAESGADLLVLDVTMPVMDGIALCRRVRASKDWARLPILMLTIKERVEDQVRGYDLGANAYLTKPFEATVLAARVQSLLPREKS